ncbi:hypothetical protein F5883DRAFT_623532 [Diaporthe sp. PMI_573]|nr:hypothetical protein F5883DRAFT_623532 [Diaporthaceae sp. PMI_573]
MVFLFYTASTALKSSIQQCDGRGQPRLFIGDDGSPIKASALILSLKDFICEEDANEEDDFEDVMLEITWKELHRFYEDSLQPHVCAEIDDEKELVIKDMKEVLKKTIELEKALHELKTPSSEEQKVLGSEHSAKARKRLDDLSKESQKHAKQRRQNMEVLKRNLERVGDGKNKDVEKAKQVLVEAENELAALEKRIAGIKSEVEGQVIPE